MKTTYKLVEDNAGMFHIFAHDFTGKKFAYFCENGDTVAAIAYALLNGASAASLEEDYGTDEDEEAFFADFEEDSNYKVILDEDGKYENVAGVEGSVVLTALFYEDAMSYELEEMSKACLMPPALADASCEEQFLSLFNVGVYARPDGFSNRDFENFVETIGRLTDTVKYVNIDESEEKLEISLESRHVKYANSAIISGAVRGWFTSDGEWSQADYEQDGASEFITLVKN